LHPFFGSHRGQIEHVGPDGQRRQERIAEMLDRLLSAELDAGVTRRCDPAGFVCQIRVPLEKLAVSAPAEI